MSIIYLYIYSLAFQIKTAEKNRIQSIVIKIFHLVRHSGKVYITTAQFINYLAICIKFHKHIELVHIKILPFFSN